MPRKGMPEGSRDFLKVLQLEHKIPVLRSYAVRLIPPAAATVTYYTMLSVSQVAGMALGVSCATPVFGPALGTLAVASASVAAAQVAFTLRKLCGSPHQKQAQLFLPRRHLLFYAVLGVVAFKVLGGSCRNLMPSDVVHPGALARGSVPAKGARYAGSAEAQVVQDLYKRDGCHHCGKRGGEGIADHMPPNVLVHDAKQRYFPQCVHCMKLQSASLRHSKRSMVFHFKRAFPEPPYLAGFCVGAVHVDDWEEGINGSKKGSVK